MDGHEGGTGNMKYWMKRALWGVLTTVGIDRRRNQHRWVYPERRSGWEYVRSYMAWVWR